jgi:hypothetical protein
MNGRRRTRLLGSTLWSGLAILCAMFVQAPAQQFPPFFQFQPTAPDVDPGIDHGNSANLPEDFQKRLVFYRSQ